MKITGKVIDAKGNPVAKAKIDATADGILVIDNQTTDDDGQYSFPYDGEEGRTLTLLVVKHGFKNHKVTFTIQGNSGQVPVITLATDRDPEPKPEPDPTPRPKRPFDWRPLAKPAGIAIVAVLVVVAVAVVLRRPKTPDPEHGEVRTNQTGAGKELPVTPDTLVELTIPSKLTNAVVSVPGKGAIRKVVVKLRDEDGWRNPQTFENSNPEARRLSFTVDRLLGRLVEASVQLDDQPPSLIRFMSEAEENRRNLIDGVRNALSFMDGVGNAWFGMNRLGAANREIFGMAYTNNSRKYLNYLQTIAQKGIKPADLAAALNDEAISSPADAWRKELNQQMLTLLAKHLNHFTQSGEPPAGFGNEIGQTYLQATNTYAARLNDAQRKPR